MEASDPELTLALPNPGSPAAADHAAAAAVRPLEAASLRARLAERRERGLIRAAQRGSKEALEALFRRHWPRAHRSAYLIVHDAAAAEDIAQEAFLAAVRALHRFDRRRPFGPWLSRIVVNRAIDWARARALRREVAIDAAPAGSALEGGQRVGGGAEADTAGPVPYSDDLIAALTSLSPEHRAVVVLRYLLEYTPGEIAALLDLPRGTVNSRLRRALDWLGTQLAEERR